MVGGGIGMGNTCKSMADSFQCMKKKNCIEYYIALSSMEILTTLLLPVHKHGIYFVSSSKS